MMWPLWRRLAPAGSCAPALLLHSPWSPAAHAPSGFPPKGAVSPTPDIHREVSAPVSVLLDPAAVDCGQDAHLASTPQFLCQCYENDIYLFPFQGCGGDRSGSLYILLSVISQTNQPPNRSCAGRPHPSSFTSKNSRWENSSTHVPCLALF